MTEKTSEWKTVSLRTELIKEIEEAIKTGRYRSISEFVSEAIRLRLEELIRTQGIPAEKTQRAPLDTRTSLIHAKTHVGTSNS